MLLFPFGADLRRCLDGKRLLTDLWTRHASTLRACCVPEHLNLFLFWFSLLLRAVSWEEDAGCCCQTCLCPCWDTRHHRRPHEPDRGIQALVPHVTSPPPLPVSLASREAQQETTLSFIGVESSNHQLAPPRLRCGSVASPEDERPVLMLPT